MANHESEAPDELRHADLSMRPLEELSEAERTELTRRYDHFMRHFRTGALNAAPSTGTARRIRKWRP
jgi:hypothetical protein